MNCSDKCPQEKLRAMGKACQHKDLKGGAKCNLLDVFDFVRAENARQKAEKLLEEQKKEAEEKKAAEAEAEKNKTMDDIVD